MNVDLFHSYSSSRDKQTGKSVLLAFDGRRFGITLDVPHQNSHSEMPALNFGPLEITTRFDSNEGACMNYSIELLRMRLINEAL